VSIIIGNLILVDDRVSRSHSISILVSFFIVITDRVIIVAARIHIVILAYLAIGIYFLLYDNWLFIGIDVIVMCVLCIILMLIYYFII
jgi:hypothetical protein